ncbi:MAG: hypothetical protein HY517_04885 [Candidatus Aenigmarchaeota archaeon]|nr:hypothetical protein [Candidatus Aenigmarchaeota archaeon]
MSVEPDLDLETYGMLAGCEDTFSTQGLVVYFFNEPRVRTNVFIYNPFAVVSCYALDDKIAAEMLSEFVDATGTKETFAPDVIISLHRIDEKTALIETIGSRVA